MKPEGKVRRNFDGLLEKADRRFRIIIHEQA
jgi:hypothetical protein